MNRLHTRILVLAALATMSGCARYLHEKFGPTTAPATTLPSPVAAQPSAPAPVAVTPPVPAPVVASPPPVPVASAAVTPPPTPAPAIAIATPAQVPPPAPVPAAHTVPVDAALPDYKPKTVLEGRMRSVGSDTLEEVTANWQKVFKTYHPNLDTNHEDKGSGTAVPALLDRVSDFGPMSRTLNENESKTFYSRKAYPLLQVRVAVDALAIYVHPSNPIVKSGLDLTQLDSIFSSSKKRGGQDITTWGQLGLTGDWANKPIDVFSRNKASGTYAFFREHVLKKGDYRTTNHEMVGSAEVVRNIEQDPAAIGYSGIGYKTDNVLTVPLSAEPAGKQFPATSEFAYSSEYPLSRYLYVAVDQKKGDPIDPLKFEFVRFIYSKQGQQVVSDAGFFPIPAKTAREELLKMGIEPGF